MEQLACLRIFGKSVKKIQVSLKSDNNKSTLHEDQYIFFIISCWFLLRMRNVSDKTCRENQNTHFVFSNIFSKIVPFMRYCGKILWSQRGYMMMWCMHIACWITKATNTHSDCVILISLPLQQWLHERASMLHHTYIVCLVSICL
jgi:hypothetical protein